MVRVSPHRSEVEGNEEQEDHDADHLPVSRAQLELTVLQRRTQEGGVTMRPVVPALSQGRWHRPTSASRASSRRRRAAFSLRSCWLSASTACSLASSPCRYSFFFRRDWQADSRFLIIRCCRFSSFAWHRIREGDALETTPPAPGAGHPELRWPLSCLPDLRVLPSPATLQGRAASSPGVWDSETAGPTSWQPPPWGFLLPKLLFRAQSQLGSS